MSELEHDRLIDKLCEDEERNRRIPTSRAQIKYFDLMPLEKQHVLHARMVSLEFVEFDGYNFDTQESEDEKRAAALHAHEFGSCLDKSCPQRLSLMSSSSSLKRKVDAACHGDAEQPHPLAFLWACRLRSEISKTTMRLLLTSNQVLPPPPPPLYFAFADDLHVHTINFWCARSLFLPTPI